MGAPVYLNVYDLTAQNAWCVWCGVGVYHTGVEVYDTEFAFGGHDFAVSGIFATKPREPPGAVVFRESICVGETDLTPQQVQALVHHMGQQYKGNAYHLLQTNCNHFASDLCMQLVGRPMPPWINRLAGLAVMLHCLLPPTWVPPLQTPSMCPEEAPKVAVTGRAVPRLADRQKDAARQVLLPPGMPGSTDFLDPPRPIMATS
ncbi:MAG: PPPDE putative peptidase domain-containing protein [Monoraphidium minutum]|nr:MAG: PPPDE putative peptidase domain-containing protein [Monoraphidium minutum]